MRDSNPTCCLAGVLLGGEVMTSLPRGGGLLQPSESEIWAGTREIYHRWFPVCPDVFLPRCLPARQTETTITLETQSALFCF